jgi:hypothetical protein
VGVVVLGVHLIFSGIHPSSKKIFINEKISKKSESLTNLNDFYGTAGFTVFS